MCRDLPAVWQPQYGGLDRPPVHGGQPAVSQHHEGVTPDVDDKRAANRRTPAPKTGPERFKQAEFRM